MRDGRTASSTAFCNPLHVQYHFYFHYFLFLSLFLPILMYLNLFLHSNLYRIYPLHVSWRSACKLSFFCIKSLFFSIVSKPIYVSLYHYFCGTHLYSSNMHVRILAIVLLNVQWFVYKTARLTTTTMLFWLRVFVNYTQLTKKTNTPKFRLFLTAT
jgi:hypothetical protein